MALENTAREETARERMSALFEAAAQDPSADVSLPGELALLGPEVIPELLQVLVQCRVPIGATTHATLEADREAHIFAALAELPRSDLRQGLQDLTTDGCLPLARYTALRVLGSIGSASELELLTHIASRPLDQTHVERGVRIAYGDALDSILIREPHGIEVLPELFGRAHLSLVERLVRSIGKTRDEASLLVLTRLLGRVHGADGLILVEIGRAAPAFEQTPDEQVLEGVRRALSSETVELLGPASFAAGMLDDTSVVPRLIELLDRHEVHVRRRARGALETITGERFGSHPQPWSVWYAAQIGWWRHEARVHLKALQQGEPAKLAKALLELSARSLFRHELALPLAYSLDRKEPDLVALGCAALGRLGSPLAVPYLIEHLEDEHDAVRKAALAALRRLTGRNIGPDAPLSGT